MKGRGKVGWEGEGIRKGVRELWLKVQLQLVAPFAFQKASAARQSQREKKEKIVI